MGFKERVKGGSWEFIFHQTKTYEWEKILVILPHAFSSLNFLGADFLASKAVTSVKIHLFWGLLCRRNSRFPLSIFWIKTFLVVLLCTYNFLSLVFPLLIFSCQKTVTSVKIHLHWFDGESLDSLPIFSFRFYIL